ncbi:hypothetical protein E8E15_000917 [Penicillium rubens]|uniref:Pc15g01330 protein n=2 Tax=Penicillium chrysogenum species complex TaxID=254878 RepID=B6H678_PENRW|nr:uncharacterized protein N7525_009139 [Penicillium rubens]KAJ5257490.1 hypothetical protein N7524_009046 [Penicillium chrysogenum]CAP83019.1 Pc15g01330 [Penicillium rubens Wisconsin 54-1255]KAF3005489.1 hypothetical protein E8E15_000917 [Penicillium rubens]KAJ5053702.1 hypothetical protein NUH16_010775 [Penicillium rubens]KAJ5830886.1 hypothetical protein N7525_009139 [Penicillium rubens]
MVTQKSTLNQPRLFAPSGRLLIEWSPSCQICTASKRLPTIHHYRRTCISHLCPPAYYADLVCTRARCYMSDLFDPTPSATPTGSVAGESGGRVSESIKDTMFYI